MNKHEKLEQKIRGLVPELQELSFGCLVQTKVTGEMCDILNEDYLGKVLLWNWGINEARCMDEEDFKILGHPIQLHHVLMAIDKIQGVGMQVNHKGKMQLLDWKVYAATAKKDPVAGVRIAADWNLSLSYADQSDEVKDFLCEVLNV